MFSLREHFSVTKNDHLALHGIDLVDLCAEYGTPLFVFDEDCLIESFERFRRAFENNYSKVIVCYSIKTNNNLAICKAIREKGAYAEAASELDLCVAETAGFPGDRVIFDGPYKPEGVLRKALEDRVLLVNVESFAEMERLDRVAGEMGVEQAVGLRINPFKSHSFFANVNPKNLIRAVHGYPECRFGFSLRDAYSAYERATKLRNLRVEGIMMHPYHGAVRMLLPLMREVHERLGIETKYLNVGGGFRPETTKSVRYADLTLDLVRQELGLRSTLGDKGGSGEDIGLIAKSITDEVRRGLGDLPEPTIITEPGSFIVGPSGILLLRVDHTKSASEFKWVIVDGGTNIVPSISVFSRHEILVANKAASSPEEMVNVAGPLLYPDDVIAIKTYLPGVGEGDVLSVFDCGAYTISSSTQFLYPRPPAVLVNSRGEVELIREKETCEDVLRKDGLRRVRD